MQYLQMFGAVYCYVLLRAFQQRSVAFAHYWWIAPVSYLMAAADVFVVAFVASHGWHLGLVMANGTGGAMGALSAVWLHSRWVK